MDLSTNKIVKKNVQSNSLSVDQNRVKGIEEVVRAGKASQRSKNITSTDSMGKNVRKPELTLI